MEKSTTLNLRVNPEVKKSAEMVLSQLGVPMATAIDMFLRQITLTGGVPFIVSLPKAPNSVNVDMMNTSLIREKLNEGMLDISNGRVRPAREIFAEFKEGRTDEAL
ncbi:MAG: type II toxin-antitoxin system RelB/DinJ family antitoxin [Synergistaceae bacterium]|nr:type II toxin-antitoxin system RelB/DinJ family antitoxin [Synergistaceae bacterium]